MKSGVCLATLALLGGACGTAADAPRPDVVLVVVDTLRADHLSFDGYGKETAPFLASLAAESVVFERAWAASSWTTPSMASLFTSVYPNQHDLWLGAATMDEAERASAGATRLPSDLETIPELMRSLGYRTFGVTDNPHLCELEGFASGFDHFRNFDYEGAPAIDAVLEEWAEALADEGPRFVYLHFMDPHAPYHRRKPWFERPSDEADEASVKRAAYDSEIRWFDEHLRSAFQRLGVGPDTLVIFTADHGEEFGDHGGWSHLFTLYSELTRVPLLVRPPGAAGAGTRVRANVSLLDVLPTLRALLGAPPGDQDEGVSLVPYWSGAPADERHVLSMRIADRTTKSAVIRGDLKLIETRSRTDPAQRRVELYDLAADPRELEDLSGERPDDVRALTEHLERFLANAPVWEAERAQPADPAKLQRLRELGYAGAATDEREGEDRE